MLLEFERDRREHPWPRGRCANGISEPSIAWQTTEYTRRPEITSTS